MSDQIPDELLAEADQLEARALAAHRRWKARRNTKIRAWWCIALGIAVGSGITALLIAAMGYLP